MKRENDNLDLLKKNLKNMDIHIDLPTVKVSSFDLAKLKQLSDLMIKEIRNEIRKQTYSVCFSENEFNETLCLKYANNHQGFVVKYDIYNDFIGCGKEEKCQRCVNNFSMSLYPMIYTDKNMMQQNLQNFIWPLKQLNC